MWAERLEHYLRPVLGLYWRLRTEGPIDVLRGSEPLILAPNHSCFLDPWLVSIVSPRHISWLITRDWYDKSAFWRQFFRAHGTLPVERTGSATIKVVCEQLEAGKLMGVFPEGRISFDGKLLPFFPGIVHMAARSGAKVVPIGICGAFELLPRTQRLPQRGTVVIKFGEPRHFPDAPMATSPPKQAIRDFLGDLRRDIGTLIGQAEAEEPAADTDPADAQSF